MARGARGKFGLASASGDTGGLSRREAIIGAVAIAAVLVVFAVFAIVSVTTESEKPELSAGTFFLPYYNDDSTNGAVGFSAVDGGPAGRLAQVPSLVGQTTNNQQWVDVYNSLSGAYLVDRKTGNTSLVLPTLTMANTAPTRLAPPASGGAAAVEGAAILGFPTDDGIYVVRRAPGSGYPGDVHLLTAGSIAGGVEVGASELPGFCRLTPWWSTRPRSPVIRASPAWARVVDTPIRWRRWHRVVPCGWCWPTTPVRPGWCGCRSPVPRRWPSSTSRSEMARPTSPRRH